jgi:pimeloyl-ACP methyl ester carboxylesterase
VHRDHTVLLHGTRFHYTEWGAALAPPVILLHGVTGHARTWDDEARALSAARRVFALDQRGHGDSDPAPDGDYTTATLCDDLATFIDSLRLAQVSLVALSMGGRVAIAYAGRYPSRVSRLVVVDIGPEIAPAGRGRVGGMMAGAPERFDSVARAIDYARTNAPRYTEALLRHRVEHGVRPLADGGFTWKYDRAIRESVRNGRWRDSIDLWPLWSAITCPTLIIRGADSDILSPEIARRMLDAQPHAELVDIPNAGHTVPGDQPEAFLETLKKFLDEQ